MGYDPFSPIAPALINVVCLPAAPVQPETFASFVAWLQTHAAVLPYASTATNGVPRTADKTTQQSSSLILRFSTDLGSRGLLHTSFFEPNRQAQVAIGLLDGSTLSEEADVATVTLQQAQADLERFLKENDQLGTQGCLLVFGVANPSSNDNAIFVPSIKDKNLPQAAVQSLMSLASSVISRALRDVESREAELPSAVLQSDRLNGAEARRNPRIEAIRAQSEHLGNGRSSALTTSFGSTREEDGAMIAPGKQVALGLLQLQGGHWSKALEQLTDGARGARDANDPAWHAKALEGILVCMLLHMWAGMSFVVPQNCYPTNTGFSSTSSINSIAEANRILSDKAIGNGSTGSQVLSVMLPGLMATIMNLYEKATMDYGDGLPPIIVCEARVRMARLLTTMSKHEKSLTVTALNDVVGQISPSITVRRSGNDLNPLVLSSSLLSSLLIESIMEAQAQLSLQLASPIYLAVCNSMSVLHLDRKQGFYLKELLQRLPSSLIEARRVGAAEAVVHPSSAGLAAFSPGDKTHAKVAEAIRALLQSAIRVYGLPQLPPEQSSDNGLVPARLISWLAVLSSGDVATRIEVLRLCIRVCDALPDWQGSAHFMSLLLFVSRQSITLTADISNAVPLIAVEEQTRLLNGMQNTINASRKLINPVLADYWDDFLVRQIESHEHPSAGKLMPHSSQDLSTTTASGTEKRDPFIYNPFSGVRSSSGPLILVKDELASFDVVLQNPLEVDIEIQSISLNTEGCRFEAHSHNVVLGPLSVQVFTLRGVPKEVGDLRVTGCRAQIMYCRDRDFSIYPNMWTPPQSTKREVSKSSSKDLLLGLTLPATTVLDLKVIDRLPRLQISSTTLVQQSVMLLEGEACSFKVTLDNPGDIPADLVLFGFRDSVTSQLQNVLSTSDLQPADMFELQHQLIARPAISRLDSDGSHKLGATTPSIGPCSTKTFEFQILGKAGLIEATILIDYAYLGKPRNEVESTFYTRQLRFTVNVTVNASVDVPRCNILSMPAHTQRPGDLKLKHNEQVSNQNPDSNDQPNQQQDHCLLQLDMRSIWPNPIQITVETASNPPTSQTEPKWHQATTQTLQPSLLERILLLIPKILIGDPFAPIPSLDTKRQFVLSTSKQTPEADLASREAFWYREALTKTLRISWREAHGTRHGTLDIRKALRLSARMIDALKIEHVRISFELHTANPDDITTTIPQQQKDAASSSFTLPRSTLATLHIKIANQTSTPLPSLLLRLQPSLHNQPHPTATDLSRKLLWSGVLQRVVPGGSMAAHETRVVELGVVALVSGVYEVRGTVEEVRSRRGERNGGGRGERRIWHAGGPCLIRAVD